MNEPIIKICDCHEKQVPLIWTFRHDGYEWWCPYCGYKEGMFGAGKDVPLTVELTKQKEIWKKKAFKYLKGDTDDWTYEYKKD